MSHPELRSRTPSEGASVARRLMAVVNLASVVVGSGLWDGGRSGRGSVRGDWRHIVQQRAARRLADRAPLLAALGGALAVLRWHVGQWLEVERQRDLVVARIVFGAAENAPETVVAA